MRSVGVASPTGFESDARAAEPLETIESLGNQLESGRVESPVAPSHGDSLAIRDPIEAALADALGRAAAASQWSTVEILSRELQARREGRAGVVDLEAERKRRGG